MILTDSKKYTEKTVDQQVLLNKKQEELYPQFFTSKVYRSDYIYDDMFPVMFITDYSPSSQFDTLQEIADSTKGWNILCVADRGRNFHGYKNRKWETMSGNLHISIKISPRKTTPDLYKGLVIIPAVAVCQTIENLLNIKPKIKWVNDILIENKKVGGFLSKTQTEAGKIQNAFTGIGLNIDTSPDLKNDKFVREATHLNNYYWDKIKISTVLRELINNYKKNYRSLLNDNYLSVFHEYKKRSIIIDKNIRIYEEKDLSYPVANGLVETIDEDLNIILKNSAHKFNNGRITIQD